VSETLEQQREEGVAVETPSQLPAQSDMWSETDALISEFDQKTATPEPDNATEQGVGENGAVSNDELDNFIASLSAPSADQQRIGQLTGELDGLKAQIRAAEELKAFNEFSDDLQKQLPSWLPEDYARVKLESLAHDPVARLAWDTRNIDPKAAALDLAHVQFALKQLQGNPNADPAKVRELNQLAYQLNVAANSAAILRQARNMILKEANGLKPPIDP